MQYGCALTFIPNVLKPVLNNELADCSKLNGLTAVRYFDSGHVGKQPEAWKEYCAEYWLKEFQE